MSQLQSIERALFSFFIVKQFIKLLRSIFKIKKSTKTLVILSLHRLGDSVFTIPAIKKIKEYYPDYNVLVVCFYTNEDIYRYYFKDDITLVLVKNHLKWFEKRIPAWTEVNKIRKFKPEILFDITHGFYSFLLSILTGASNNFGMNKPHLKLAYNHFVITRITPHLMDMYLDVARLSIPFEDVSVNKLFKPNYSKNGFIFINTLSGWKAKEWGFDKFIVLAKVLSKDYNVLFIHQSGSVNSNAFVENGLEFIETENIKELIENLENCSLLIGNDSGPIYIASMMGKPTYTIYGPTNPIYSLPFGEHHKFFRKKIDCSPLIEQYCYLDAGKKCKTIDCLRSINVEDMLYDLIGFIDQLQLEKK